MIQTEDSWNTAGVLEIVALVTFDNFKNGCDGEREGGTEPLLEILWI